MLKNNAFPKQLTVCTFIMHGCNEKIEYFFYAAIQSLLINEWLQ